MKRVFCCWMSLLFLGVCHGASAAVFTGANDAEYPWLHHWSHGWMHASTSYGGGTWLWDTQLGWVWTSEAAYPWFYEPMAGWVKYKRETREPRQFLDQSTASWLQDTGLPWRESYFPIPIPPKTFTWFYTVNGGEPVTGSVDGDSMTMQFVGYRVDLSTTHMRRTTSLSAILSGTVNVDGEWYTFSGDLNLETNQSLGPSAFGLFEKEIDLWMQMGIEIDGQSAYLKAEAKASGFDQYLMIFPWQTDLYEEPIGKTYEQQINTGKLAGTVRFELGGHPEETEEEFFDIPFDPLPQVRMEILARHESYVLNNGQSFQRVVELLVTQTIPDPSTGAVLVTESRMWLAPGIGMIKMIEENPFTDEPIVVEYDFSWM